MSTTAVTPDPNTVTPAPSGQDDPQFKAATDSLQGITDANVAPPKSAVPAYDDILGAMTKDDGKPDASGATKKPSIAKAIVAGAIRGLFAGMAAPPGPGHVMAGGALGFAAQEKHQADVKENADKEQVRKIQIAEHNMRMADDAANLRDKDQKFYDNYVATNKDEVDNGMSIWDGTKGIEHDDAGNPKQYSSDEIKAKIKDKSISIGSDKAYITGYHPVNGQLKPLFSIWKDAVHSQGTVTVTPEMAQTHGLPQQAVGQQVSPVSTAVTSTARSNALVGNTVTTELQHDANAGGSPEGKKLADSLPQFDMKAPGVSQAMFLLNKATKQVNPKTGLPYDIYGGLALLHANHPNAYQTIMNQVGGGDVTKGENLVRDISNQYVLDQDRKKKLSEAEGTRAANPDNDIPTDTERAAAKKSAEGYGKNGKSGKVDSEFANLSTEMDSARTKKDLQAISVRADTLNAQKMMKQETESHANDLKDVAQSDAKLKRSETAWTDNQHGYIQANANFGMIDRAIDGAKDGNGLFTSFVPAMEALGVSVAQGSHRVSPADATAAGAPGGWAERFNAWAAKAADGKLTPQLVQEGHALVKDLRLGAYSSAIQKSRLATFGIPQSKVPVYDLQGNLTTLDRAPTKTVMGPDKKMHYTNDNGTLDLGLAQ